MPDHPVGRAPTKYRQPWHVTCSGANEGWQPPGKVQASSRVSRASPAATLPGTSAGCQAGTIALSLCCPCRRHAGRVPAHAGGPAGGACPALQADQPAIQASVTRGLQTADVTDKAASTSICAPGAAVKGGLAGRLACACQRLPQLVLHALWCHAASPSLKLGLTA